MAKGTIRVQTPRKMLILGLIWEQLMSSLLLLEGLDPTIPVMSMARLLANEDGSEPKRARILTQPTLSFSDEDKAGTI